MIDAGKEDSEDALKQPNLARAVLPQGACHRDGSSYKIQ